MPPPDEEQKKIAKLLVNIEQSVEALTGLELALERLRKAYILETFSRYLDDDSAIPKVKASQAGEVLMGRQRAPQYDRGLAPRPYLRVANVYDGYIDISDVKEMDSTDDEFEQYKLYPGDVLLNEGQSRELVGRSSVFKGEIADCCFQNTLIRFRPQRVSSQYAQHYFQYCLYSGKFIAISKQTTSIAHLGVSRFAEISFPIAQPEQESRIVTSLSRIEMKLRATIERKEQLKQVKRTVLSLKHSPD